MHGTFNVSIPSTHIPQFPEEREGVDTYEFVSGLDAPGADEILEEEEMEKDDNPISERGQWRSTSSTIPISGPSNELDIEFTVIGYCFAAASLFASNPNLLFLQFNDSE